MRVVLDANVLVAGFAGAGIARSVPGEIIRRWRSAAFDLISSDHIIAEVAKTLEKPYFRRRLSPGVIQRAITLLREYATVVQITVHVQGVATHPEDDLVLATALSGEAEYLVTGDHELQQIGSYESLLILAPRDFISHLIRASQES